MRIWAWILAAAVALATFSGPPPASAQHPNDVEVISKDPVLPDGQVANAPISRQQAVKNWTARGLGCCVMASNAANANFLGVKGFEEAIKKISKEYSGGHDPDKYEQQMRRVRDEYLPDLVWHQWWDDDEEKLYEWSEAGWPIGVTCGTGIEYGMQPVAHEMSLIHIDRKVAQVLDNNFIDQYSSMPTPEFLRRWRLFGPGWGQVITSGRPPGFGLTRGLSQQQLIVVGSVAAWCGALFLLYQHQQRRPAWALF